jgi:hypothetical protein
VLLQAVFTGSTGRARHIQHSIAKIAVYPIDGGNTTSHYRPIQTKQDFMTPRKTPLAKETVSYLLSA